MTRSKSPKGRGAGFRAAEYLYQNKITAPIRQADLFLLVDFGTSTANRIEAMGRAIASGWLTDVAGGKVEISPAGHAHFSAIEQPTEKYCGQVATVREIDVFSRPVLSKKYMPNSRGNRDDVPSFTARTESHHFFTRA